MFLNVLILVLMEYGLWPAPRSMRSLTRICLNPCSNGIWSLTKQRLWSSRDSPVLILVLMEYGLWRRLAYPDWLPDYVLILVLMEYGLWQSVSPPSQGLGSVLILVLMEYGLWPQYQLPPVTGGASLNPCSNGIWSLTDTGVIIPSPEPGLNPCSNGIWSLTWEGTRNRCLRQVLILVLMEYGLWHIKIIVNFVFSIES